MTFDSEPCAPPRLQYAPYTPMLSQYQIDRDTLEAIKDLEAWLRRYRSLEKDWVFIGQVREIFEWFRDANNDLIERERKRAEDLRTQLRSR